MGKKLYVGNLSYEVDSSELEQLFAQHGQVVSAQIINDRETGRSKGFGFVEMSSDQEAQDAIAALNGLEHGGRTLTVNEARPREDRGGGGVVAAVGTAAGVGVAEAVTVEAAGVVEEAGVAAVDTVAAEGAAAATGVATAVATAVAAANATKTAILRSGFSNPRFPAACGLVHFALAIVPGRKRIRPVAAITATAHPTDPTDTSSGCTHIAASDPLAPKRSPCTCPRSRSPAPPPDRKTDDAPGCKMNTGRA